MAERGRRAPRPRPPRPTPCPPSPSTLTRRATSTTPSRCAREGDGYRAHVHIADVSYFVDVDGAIEREARRRTSSLYLPLFAEPMLPAAAQQRPLQPGAAAAAQDASPWSSPSTPTGRRTGAQFYRSLISSDHRLTYGFVDGVLGRQRRRRRRRRPTRLPPAAPDGCRRARRHRRRRAAPRPTRPLRPTTRCARSCCLAAELAGVLRRRALRARRAHDRLLRARVRASTRGRAAWPPRRASRRRRTRWSRSSCWPPTRRWPSSCCARRRTPCTACTSRRSRRATRAARRARGARACPRRRSRPAEGVPAAELAAAYGGSSRSAAQSERPRGSRPARLVRAPAALAQAGALRARSTSATSASPARRTCTSPRRSAATPTWCRTGPARPPRRGRPRARRRRARRRRRRTARRASATLASSSSRPTTSPCASCSSAACRRRAGSSEFTGEIVGLVGGGAFVRFGDVFEGFLSSRRLGGERLEESSTRRRSWARRRGRRYRLGDAVDVRVERVDRLAGKVDLAPVGSRAADRRPGRGGRPRPRPAARRPGAATRLTDRAGRRRVPRPASARRGQVAPGRRRRSSAWPTDAVR